MKRLLGTLLVLGAFILVPTLVHAQSTLAGVVRDTSGAVLPGVTVEAASPALIEKVRSGVTDGNGQYRITDLPPGTYTVTYTLPGFTRVVREGVMLTGSGVTTINADLRVGALQETITVTGETPVVDVAVDAPRDGDYRRDARHGSRHPHAMGRCWLPSRGSPPTTPRAAR